MMTHLAMSLNAPILYIEYSLSPEHVFPTANKKIFNVYKELNKKCSPWVDLNCNNNSYTTKKAVDSILNKDFLYSHALMYTSGKIKKANPGEIKFKKFPPVFLLVGTDEVLNDDSKNFYSYIKPIQKKAKLKEFEGQKHVWLFSHIDSKESAESINDIKEFITSNSK